MSENKHLTPVWIIYVDGKRLDVKHEGALRRITVNDRLNGVSTFSVLFDTTETKVRDLGLISLESEISIHIGYKDDVEELFSGEVLAFRAVFPEYGTEQLEVTGCNVLHKLARGSSYRSFEEQSPSDIISGLIDSYSLKADVDSFGTAQPFSSEEGLSDYEYLMRVAGAYGKDVFADKTTVYVKDEISVRSDEVIFEWGKSLISFEAEQNIRNLLSRCDYIGWDPLKNESFTGGAALSDIAHTVGGSSDWTGVSKGGGGKFTALAADFGLKDADDAKQQAAGMLQKNSFSFGRASGSAEGNYKLRPGMRVTIKMVGEAFEGEYIADSVCHRFDHRSGYVTEFGLKRNMCP
ncbi:phage late control D family protein [Breznakiella homolactica]|uniref:Phage late control D family protein n=1 Tax=Breznakiella homolactica TaxID=2798577 RepID=A0A7T8BBA2_9SPIR|nr:hypothetical protein [Breznakiella homolactica]QQO09018.1 hypothetical protein JFL75_19135 [Breznakiella homolactica]